MAAGNTNTAGEYVSSKAKGALAQLREGGLDDDKTEELTNLFIPFDKLSAGSDQSSNTSRSVRNSKKQTITFKLKKEDDVFKITEMTYTKVKK